MHALILRTILLALGLSAWTAASAKTVLFVGNSFTFGAHSPVRTYRPDIVTDLNRQGVGGVPALFKTFADQAGLDFTVSLETAGGMGLDYHYTQKRALIDRRWDVVVLQGYSTLDRNRPGDPVVHISNAVLLAQLFRKANPAVRVELVSTWSRADLAYTTPGRWYGRPIESLATDLRTASNLAIRNSRNIAGIIPVGEAWNRAFATRIADPNPYDGVAFGQVDLWTYDQYHASAEGYYLEALTIFGRLSGLDPRRLGAQERAADELGISPTVAVALQRVAYDQLQADR